MSITTEDLLQLLPGRVVVVTSCEAAQHGANSGCVCTLKGKTVTVGRRYDTVFVGTPSWHLQGHSKTVRLSEITLLADTLPREGA